MMKKQFWAVIMALVMVLMMAPAAFAEENPVAQIGEIGYATLQEAINAATNGDIVTLLTDCGADVTITQTEGVNLTIDGNEKQYSGTIYIHGNARYEGEETLTIQNVAFATSEATHDFISANSTGSVERYAHNVTVRDCAFAYTGEEAENSVVGLRTRQAYDIAIKDCTFDGMHSVIQASGDKGLLFEDVTVTNCKSGFNLNHSTEIMFDGCDVTVKEYAIRAGQSSGNDATVDEINITNCALKTTGTEDAAIVLRGDAYAATITLDNSTIETNGTAAIEAVGLSANSAIVVKADAKTAVTDNGDGTWTVEVAEPVVELDGVPYTSIKDALDTLKSADTTVHNVKILTDHKINVNYSTYNYPILINGFNVVLDLNGKTITADWSDYTGERVDNSLIGICNGGKLTVKDSVGEGKIVNNDTKENVENRIFWVMNGTATKELILNIEGGSFEQNDVNTALLYIQGNGSASTDQPVTVNIKGGHFSSVNDDLFNAYDGNKYTAYITGGTFNRNPTDYEIKIHPDYSVKNESNLWSVVEKYVAQVGECKFETLGEAVRYAHDNFGTVTLLADVELGAKLTISSNVTIEGEYTITRDDAYTGTLFAVSAGAALTLDGGLTIDGGNDYQFNAELYAKDLADWQNAVPSEKSTKWFTPEEGAPVATAYMITTSGIVNLNDVAIQNHYSTNGSGIVSAGKGANVTLDGAQIKHNASTSGSGLVVNASAGVWSREEELITVTMNDGTVIDGNHVGGNHGIFKVYMGTYFTMNGGEIKNTTGWNSNGTAVGIYHAVFTMNGGTICSNSSVYGPNNGRNAAIYGHSNHLFTMNDGTICHNTGRSKAGVDSPYSETGYTGQTFIYGGTVVDNKILGSWTNPDVSGGATLTITGGTYTQDVSQWCAKGYFAQDSGDGSYIVVEDEVAKVVETGEIYATLQDALNACTNGETVKLLKDITYYEKDIVYPSGGGTGFGKYDEYNPSIIYFGGTAGATAAENQPSTVNAVLDLNGYSITNNADAYLFLPMDNSKLTFKDSVGTGSITNTTEAPVIWVVGTDTLVTIESGKYVTANAEGLLWSTHGGDLVIKGGEFSTTADDASLLIVRNEGDRKNPNYFVDGKATITVTGGTYHGFDPEKTFDDSTEPYTEFNSVADGYISTEDSDNIWTVREPKSAELTTDIGDKKFVVGKYTEFTFTTTANDDAGVMVIGTSNFSDTEGNEAAIDALEYWTGTEWADMKGQNFGPSTGFPMSDATSKFRVKFNATGDYTFTASMINVETQKAICSTEVEFSVTRASSGGGGGSSSSSYQIVIEDTDNGTVTASSKSAKKNATVTLTVTADDGYELDELTVTDKNGKEITVTKKDSGKYTFTMPSGKVTVEATFAADEQDVTTETVFDDVDDKAYYADAVKWAVENDVTTGTSKTTFGPGEITTRAQTVTFLWRAMGEPAAKTTVCPFEDVTEGAYYYDAVLWAVENGITEGTSATEFSPNETVTRAQTVTFLWRMAGKPEVAAANAFGDVDADAYYYQAVEWAVKEEITSGTSATTFSPAAACARAQIVTFLYNYLGK